jgi:hypothetical protein
MPTPAKTRFHPRGLSVREHEALALKVRHLVADARALRDTTRAGLGDGHDAAQAAEEALWALRRVQVSLAEALPGSGGDAATTQELRALYIGNGA